MSRTVSHYVEYRDYGDGHGGYVIVERVTYHLLFHSEHEEWEWPALYESREDAWMQLEVHLRDIANSYAGEIDL